MVKSVSYTIIENLGYLLLEPDREAGGQATMDFLRVEDLGCRSKKDIEVFE